MVRIHRGKPPPPQQNPTGYHILEEKVTGKQKLVTLHLGFKHILLTVTSAIFLYVL